MLDFAVLSLSQPARSRTLPRSLCCSRVSVPPVSNTQPLPSFSTTNKVSRPFCHATSPVTPILSIACAQFPSPRRGWAQRSHLPLRAFHLSRYLLSFQKFHRPRRLSLFFSNIFEKTQGWVCADSPHSVRPRPLISSSRCPRRSLAFGGFGSRFSGVRLSFLLTLETSILKHLPFTIHFSLFTSHSPLTLPVPATYNPAVPMNAGLSHFDRRRLQ